MDKNLILKTGVIKELGDEGTGIARIAILSAIDSDGDTYLAGAFGEQHVKVLPAHNTGSVPLGRARIYEQGDEALAEFQLNLDTEAGREWHAALKFDFESGNPLQEWSYGFRIVDASSDRRDGENVRVLKKLKVHEISPVVLGAGVGTATLSVKQRGGAFGDQIAAVAAELQDVTVRAQEIKALRAGDGRDLSAERRRQLEELKAQCSAIGAIGDEIGVLLDNVAAAADGEQASERDLADARKLHGAFEYTRSTLPRS